MVRDRREVGGMSVDDALFRDFVHGSQKRLVNFAEFLVGDRGRGEDLVQDAYIKVYAKWSRLHDQNPEAYVRRCIISGRADWWRRRASSELVTDHMARSTGDDAMGASDQRLVVLAALHRLTSRERTVVVLRYYLGMSETEIASQLGLASGTVKSTAARAVGKLRRDPSLDEGAIHDAT
jgi:RNA polymerase sigma-70 factor (sigma-E family)